MLAYVLALVIGLGSFGLYMAAFFFPEVHRKNDFIWSGVGLFYALVLWVCADRISGGVLLGQTASVALLGWLGWQTLTLRRQVTPAAQRTAVPSSEAVKEKLSTLASPETLAQIPTQIGGQLAKLKPPARSKAAPAPKVSPLDKAAEKPYVPLSPDDFGPEGRIAMQAEAAPETVTTAAIAAETIPDTAEAATPNVDSPAVEQESRLEQPVATPIAAKTSKQPTAQSTKPTKPTIPVETAEQGGGVFGTIASAFKGLGQKKPPKPVYVRKQFRTPDAETEAAIATAAEATPTAPSTPEKTAESAIAVPPEATIAAQSVGESATTPAAETPVTETEPEPPAGVTEPAKLTETVQRAATAPNTTPEANSRRITPGLQPQLESGPAEVQAVDCGAIPVKEVDSLEEIDGLEVDSSTDSTNNTDSTASLEQATEQEANAEELGPENMTDQEAVEAALVGEPTAPIEATVVEVTLPEVMGAPPLNEGSLPADVVIQEEIVYEATHLQPENSEFDRPAVEASPAVEAEPAPEVPRAIPPRPPSPELVEAALADAEEKHVPASPPAVIDPD